MLARSPAEDRFEPTAGAGPYIRKPFQDVEFEGNPVYPSLIVAVSRRALGQVHRNFEEEVDLSFSFPVLFGSPPLDKFFEVRWRIAHDRKVTGSSLGFMRYTPGPLTIDPC